MKLAELLLFGVAGWSGLGLIGVAISRHRGEGNRVRRGVWWLVSVWAVYVCALIGVSLEQRQRVVALGEPQCFDEMCFTVMRVEEVPGFLLRDGQRLLRVTVQVANHGRTAHREGSIAAYLIDAQGRRWDASRGVGGVGLNASVGSEETILSEPVFQVTGDAHGLRLVLTEGRRLPGVLVIGDSDSLLHQRTVMNLNR